MKYVIRWKSKVNGRAGRGSKEFSQEQAEQLASELNAEYPDIEHEVIPAPPPRAAAEQPETEPESDQSKSATPVHALS